MTAGFQIPSESFGIDDYRATGFGTPKSDTSLQFLFEPPSRVIPIIFLPGVMGSNLRIRMPNDERLRLLRRDKNDANSDIAWRPDNIGALNATKFSQLTPGERQLLLDPATTEVDVYNPDSSRSEVDGDGRHSNVVLAYDCSSPLLRSDPAGTPKGKTATQKARMRGWGEVFFGSYGELLQRVETRMQNIWSNGRLAAGWDEVIGVDPVNWKLDPSTPQQALTVKDLKASTKETYFPVHAIGYNWLISNRRSAQAVAKQIRDIVQTYRRKRSCPGVIVVTHSMGGLVGRALVHPEMGGLKDLVLGIVHGVQPAIGAPAAYRRMHAGFEDAGMVLGPTDSITAKVAGNFGDEVTAVMAGSAGGLQLLPNKAYGNGWLRFQSEGQEIHRLPAGGDPYEEIYKLRGKWFGLFPSEDWINPSGLAKDSGGRTLQQTHDALDIARQFHDELADTYHPETYVHYGVDPKHRAFGTVTWKINVTGSELKGWKEWPIVDNTRQGTLTFIEDVAQMPQAVDPPWTGLTPAVTATLEGPDEPGDQTVPARSADRQMLKGHCKAVFRQVGYDHQGSFQNEAVLAATLFSILRIAHKVRLP